MGILVAIGSASIPNGDYIESTLDSLFRRLCVDAQSPDVTKSGARIAVRRVPSHVAVVDLKSAMRVLEKSRGVFLIWAQATYGRLGGQEGLDLGRVYFVVRHRQLTDPEQALFVSDLEQVHIPQRNYRVMLQNDIIDVAAVSQGLAGVSKYQIGLAAAASGARDIAIALLEESLQLGSDAAPYQKVARRAVANLRIALGSGRAATAPQRGPAAHPCCACGRRALGRCR